MRPILLAASLFLMSCAAAPGAAPQTPGLEGEWIMATRALRPPTITFEESSAAGFAGCNRWFAQMSRSGEAIQFSGVGATRMACPEPEMTIERNFLAALEQTRAVSVNGDTLVLRDEHGSELATFLRAP